MNISIRSNKGSILVEAFISLTVVAVGALSLMNLQGNLIRSNSELDQKNQALQIAKTKIEQLRNYTTMAEYNAISTGTDTVSAVSTSFNRSWQVVSFNDPSYKTVTVTVAWNKSSGAADSVALNTRIASLDPVNEGKAVSSTYTNMQPLSPSNAQTQTTTGDTTTPPDGTDPVANPNIKTQTLNDGSVVTYNTDTQQATINGNVAIWISGTVKLATGPNAPNSTNLSSVTVSSSGVGSNYCFYDVSVDTLYYTCVVQHTVFVGTINVGGVTGVKLCASMPSNQYTSPTQSLTNQDYVLFKSNRSCSGTTPNFISNL